MTHQAKTFLEALLMDLKNNPDIPPKHALAAVILGTRQGRFGPEDFREMMTVVRCEYGAAPATWEAMAVQLLSELPNISQANAEDLSRQ